MAPSPVMSHQGYRGETRLTRSTGCRWVGTPSPVPVRPGRSPAGARCTMAAANFVQEMRSMGEKLLLKLQKLPQAEPVEIAAFSVILLFTGKLRLSRSPQRPWFFLASGKGETTVLARALAEVAGCPPDRGEADVPGGGSQRISRILDNLLMGCRGNPKSQPGVKGEKLRAAEAA